MDKVQSLKCYKREYLKNDIISGIVVALISIPISMGYSQVAGLPLVYGLYGSLLPIIVFGLMSSSPQFVFGVDAAPAALTGGTVAALGIVTGSSEAMRVVPVITFVTAVWLALFALLRAGKLVGYISKPVLGGFISGIASTIILMQVSKLFGGAAGTGEVVELAIHIAGQLPSFNVLSCVMGVGTIVIIRVCRRVSPKFPMSVIMLVVGALSTVIFHVQDYGVTLLSAVESGLPHFKALDLSVIASYPQEIIMGSLTTALVIVSSTLLTSSNYAVKNDYKLNNNREIISYSAANMVAAFTGCCPLNGSASRSAIAEQFGVHSQVMSLVAGATMALVLMFGTPLIAYLPVPVLTGIVIAALMGVIEADMAKKLWKTDKTEFGIFMAAFAGVLIFGTIYGVMIGVILSFVSVIIKASVPPRSRMGVIPGEVGFYNMNRNRRARAIKNTVIYRFNGPLFFANVDVFIDDCEEAATQPGLKILVVDAGGISSVDITAADRLLILADKLKKKNIRFYITEHNGTVNDQLRKLGAGSLIEEGHVRRTISLALRDAGLERPYELEEPDRTIYAGKDVYNIEETRSDIDNKNASKHDITRAWRDVASVRCMTDEGSDIPIESNEALAEIEWAFGDDADEVMEKMAMEVAQRMAASDNPDEEFIKEAEKHLHWGRIGLFDESELLDRIEMHLSEIAAGAGLRPEQVETLIEHRREEVEHKLDNINPGALEALQAHRRKVASYIKENNPEAYEHVQKLRRLHIEHVRENNPKLAEKLENLSGKN